MMLGRLSNFATFTQFQSLVCLAFISTIKRAELQYEYKPMVHQQTEDGNQVVV
jgi:hypothetical protein